VADPDLHLEINDGIMLVGSDGHFWPGAAPTAHKAFVRFIRDLKPKIVIANGDVFDGGSISRHPPIGWQTVPDVMDELHACQERMAEIENAAGKNCKLCWTRGNHDQRWNTRLATTAPEFCRVHGFALEDHFSSRWDHAMAVFVNSDIVVKHRFKGGAHATFNNALWSGKTVITGHLHSQRISPITDYGRTRWGVDTGCLAYIHGPQFAYTESNPSNWVSGFGVFTFHQKQLLPPELCSVWSDERSEVVFRGKIMKI
jgi:hypothetical protein